MMARAFSVLHSNDVPPLSPVTADIARLRRYLSLTQNPVNPMIEAADTNKGRIRDMGLWD